MFKLWYTGKEKSRNGVGIIVDKYWKKEVVEVKKLGDRIIVLKFVVERDIFNVISAYTPLVGLEEHQNKILGGFRTFSLQQTFRRKDFLRRRSKWS